MRKIHKFQKKNKIKVNCALFLFMLCFVLFILTPFSYPKDEQTDIDVLKKSAPKIYLDCPYCDIDYIRTEITFVNYVWDRKEADVHILVTTQRTGAGGREYTISLIGLKDFADIQITLKYISQKNDTEDDIRRRIVKVLKKGLAPYIARTPLSDLLSVSFKEKAKPTSVEDKWNFWVFSIGFRGYLSGEKTRNSTSIRGNFSANRVTPDLKLRFGVSARSYESHFKIGDETISSTSERKSFSGLFVKSINNHWSVGAWLSLSSSTYSNIKFAISPAPAIEYDLFPYSESTRRQLRFLYKLGYNFSRYWEETIYDKTSENLFGESLSVTLELKEPWGTITTSIEGSHYFHDLSKYRLELWGDLGFKLFKGLSLNIWGGYSRIHDQLSLPKGETSLEEILLQRKELATSYDYYVSIGLSYTFGSIFSNVVNPRFGDSGGGRGRFW